VLPRFGVGAVLAGRLEVDAVFAVGFKAAAGPAARLEAGVAPRFEGVAVLAVAVAMAHSFLDLDVRDQRVPAHAFFAQQASMIEGSHALGRLCITHWR
jgi:hypothetical protein